MSYFDRKLGIYISYEEAARSWITRNHLDMVDRADVENRMKIEDSRRKDSDLLKIISPPIKLSWQN